MSNIYTLPNEIEETLFKYYWCFDEETGELIVEESVLKEIESNLFDLQNRKDELLTWYLQDRSNRLAHNAGIDAEIERLQKMKKQNDSKIKRVEKIVDYNFKEDFNGKAVLFWNFKVSYRKSKQTIIENEDLIPEKFIKRETIEKVTIPKTQIKKAIEAGETVEGAKIQENMILSIK